MPLHVTSIFHHTYAIDDGDPYPLSDKGGGGGGLDCGSLNQDGGGHGDAIRVEKFDGQQVINSGLGDVAFGPGPHGDVGGDVVTGSGADAQVSDQCFFCVSCLLQFEFSRCA